jgi:hypothetical protein
MFCAGSRGREKAAKSKYEANTQKRWHVKKFIARWPGGSQNGKWWEIKGLTTVIQAAVKKTHILVIFFV